MSDDPVTSAIETSIAGLDGSEASGSDSSAATPSAEPSTPAAPPTETATAAPVATPEGQTPPATPDTPQMPVPETPPTRRGPVPWQRHESALATVREEGQKAVAAVKAEYESQTAAFQAKSQLLEVADQDPARFLNALMRADPRYLELVTAMQQASAAGPTGRANGQEMPGPDAQLSDGSVGYSPQGLKALLDWHADQVEARVATRYRSLEEEHRASGQIRAAVGRVSQQVQDAQAWPGFAQHQVEIAAALKQNRTLSLEGAYRQVVLPKFQMSRDALRAEILAEINGKPKAASATTPTGGVPPSSSSDDLESIIRASIAGLAR